jgi:hypothetical protein
MHNFMGEDKGCPQEKVMQTGSYLYIYGHPQYYPQLDRGIHISGDRVRADNQKIS